jgi:hypothetical protein
MNSIVPSSITTSKTGLDFSFPDLFVKKEPVSIIKTDDDTYSAMLPDRPLSRSYSAFIDRKINSTNVNTEDMLMTNASLNNIEVDRVEAKSNIDITGKKLSKSTLNDDMITKFYISSISILGLYVFYRILITHK